MSQRLDYVDLMRGIAIILVAAGHVIQYNGVGVDNAAFRFIYSFHMPLFFLISGYITARVSVVNSYESLVTFIKRKTQSIALPWIVWTFLIVPFSFKNEFIIPSIDYVASELKNPSIWFLHRLYTILIIYGLTIFCSLKISQSVKALLKVSISSNRLEIISYIIVVSMLATIYVKTGHIYGLMEHSYAFFIGAIIGKYAKAESMVMKDFTFSLSALAFVFIVGYYSYDYTTFCPLTLLLGPLSFFILLFITRKVAFNEYIHARLLNYGKISLAIYLIQSYMCKNILSYKLTNLIELGGVNPFWILFISILISFVVCELCSVITRVIQSSPLLNTLLLGSRYHKK